MDPLALNPFSALTMVAAPAILTNASSVLAMSTSQRFLRASERMRQLHAELEKVAPGSRRAKLVEGQVTRVERQAVLLLRGLGSAYVGMGSFASAALISLIGATMGSYSNLHTAAEVAMVLALGAGLAGVCALVFGCTQLFGATRLATLNILDEGACIQAERREREAAASAASV